MLPLYLLPPACIPQCQVTNIINFVFIIFRCFLEKLVLCLLHSFVLLYNMIVLLYIIKLSVTKMIYTDNIYHLLFFAFFNQYCFQVLSQLWHLFLLLYNVPCYEYTIIYPPVDEYLCLQFRAFSEFCCEHSYTRSWCSCL